ncbi:hypothetical protein LX32DRAFT_75787 [Colletotrichum zoysiae]|uniref:Uncharacterized protein n=1 Tax=Colletotrichum zoysiae TaxID=1216348 RepID=A0AAD9HR61_9PEZI|nr:hypothetical protein LX32DRAFT_75787 [Colletotrichum zoysiae]
MCQLILLPVPLGQNEVYGAAASRKATASGAGYTLRRTWRVFPLLYLRWEHCAGDRSSPMGHLVMRLSSGKRERWRQLREPRCTARVMEQTRTSSLGHKQRFNRHILFFSLSLSLILSLIPEYEHKVCSRGPLRFSSHHLSSPAPLLPPLVASIHNLTLGPYQPSFPRLPRLLPWSHPKPPQSTDQPAPVFSLRLPSCSPSPQPMASNK